MGQTKTMISLLLLWCSLQCLGAKEYNASLFGIKSNGTTLNTRSIQAAIDYIHQEGGGTLHFYVGRYLTGTFFLKSNVTIHLHEGAILLGSTNPYDYDTVFNRSSQALIGAYRAEKIALIGKGVIEGQGRAMAYNRVDLIHKGLIDDDLRLDRPTIRPTLIYLRECQEVTIDGVVFRNAAFWVNIYDQCDRMTVNNVTIDSKAFWNNDGIDIVDCTNFTLTNSYIDATDDAICLKSHDATKRCENVEIRNNVARSSASGIKFGTVSRGGYKNVRIINNTVYNTHRSAITIATPDGGNVEDILVDSLYAYNTSNAIFLRIGRRWVGDRPPGYMRNITLQNIYCEIPATKADKGYDYEGPVEDLPRNISPSSIVGIPGHEIENVTLRNIHLLFPGGGDPGYAYRGTQPEELDAIPEMEARYPEYSQFKELPAWAFWVRHAKNITFENVTLTAKKRDYRPAIVLQEVDHVTLKEMHYREPGEEKKQVDTYKTTNVITE